MKSKMIVGILLIIFSLSCIVVSAYVYEQASLNISQNIIDVVTLTLKDSDLGLINEGETKTYTKVEVPALGDAIVVKVDDSVSEVDLSLDSDLDSLSDYYSTFDVVVRFSLVIGSTYSVGDVACVLSIDSDDYSSIGLDAVGIWKFDFEVTTVAKSVSSNVPSSVSITIYAEKA